MDTQGKNPWDEIRMPKLGLVAFLAVVSFVLAAWLESAGVSSSLIPLVFLPNVAYVAAYLLPQLGKIQRAWDRDEE